MAAERQKGLSLDAEERAAFTKWAMGVGIWDDVTVNAIANGTGVVYSPTLQETLSKWKEIRASGQPGRIDCIVCNGSGKLWPADSPCHACHGSGHWVVSSRD